MHAGLIVRNRRLFLVQTNLRVKRRLWCWFGVNGCCTHIIGSMEHVHLRFISLCSVDQGRVRPGVHQLHDRDGYFEKVRGVK